MDIRSYRNQRPRLGARAYIDRAAVVVGDVDIGEDASLWPFTVARGDVNFIRIGARTNVQDGAVLHVTHDGDYTPGGFPLVIGSDVTIGHGAIVHGTFVGRGSLIGMGSTLLSRTKIGRECLVAAGAVVPPGLEVPDRMLVMGVPGKIARPIKEQDLQYMKWLTDHYVELARQYVKGDAAHVRPKT